MAAFIEDLSAQTESERTRASGALAVLASTKFKRIGTASAASDDLAEVSAEMASFIESLADEPEEVVTPAIERLHTALVDGGAISIGAAATVARAGARFKSLAVRAAEANARMAGFVEELSALDESRRSAAAAVLSPCATSRFKASAASADIVGERMAAFLEELAAEPEAVADGAARMLDEAAARDFARTAVQTVDASEDTQAEVDIPVPSSSLPAEVGGTISALKAQVEALSAPGQLPEGTAASLARLASQVEVLAASVDAHESSLAGLRAELARTPTRGALSPAASSDRLEGASARAVPPGETRVATSAAVAKADVLAAAAALVPDSPRDVVDGERGAAGELSRALRARLLRSGASAALPPDVLEAVERSSAVERAAGPERSANAEQAELADPRAVSDIVLQILAYSPGSTAASTAGKTTAPSVVPSRMYFGFQFYDYAPVETPSARLSEAPQGVSAAPGGRNLYWLEADVGASSDVGAEHVGLPGLLYRYAHTADMGDAGEARRFTQYLARGRLCLDVWDGDSRLPVGTASVPLAGLLRAGRGAADALVEVSVVRAGPDSTAAGPGASDNVDGTVLLRLINVGRHRIPASAASAGALVDTLDPVTAGTSSEPALVSPGVPVMVRAALDVGGVIAPELVSNTAGYHSALAHAGTPAAGAGDRRSELVVGDQTSDAPARLAVCALERRRLARLRKLAELKRAGGDELLPPGLLASADEDKENTFVRSTALHDVCHARDRRREEVITASLRSGLSRTATVRAAYGECVHFEAAFTNPLPRDALFKLVVDDPDGELSLVTSEREWAELRAAAAESGVGAFGTGPVEDLFDDGDVLLLSAGETVTVPFRFQSYRAGDVRSGAALEGAARGLLALEGGGVASPATPKPGPSVDHSALRARTAVVRMVTMGGDESERTVVCDLRVAVCPRAYGIDRTLRLHAGEGDYLRQRVRLATLPGASSAACAASRPCVVASDPTILTEGDASMAASAGADASAGALSEPNVASFTVKLGAAPAVRSFLACVYADASRARLLERWRVEVRALRRHDVRGVAGQRARTSVALRGPPAGAADEPVRVYSSHPDVVIVDPDCESLVLRAGALTELRLSYTPLVAGTTNAVVHVVRASAADLDGDVTTAIAVAASADEPLVSGQLELGTVTAGRVTTKRLAYTNPFGEPRVFRLACSRGWARASPVEMELAAGERRFFVLEVEPPALGACGSALLAHLFINDAHDCTVDALELRAEVADAREEVQVVD